MNFEPLSRAEPKALDSMVALNSVMAGKCGLMRSSIVTVAKELKAEEMVLQRQKPKFYTDRYHQHSYVVRSRLADSRSVEVVFKSWLKVIHTKKSKRTEK